MDSERQRLQDHALRRRLSSSPLRRNILRVCSSVSLLSNSLMQRYVDAPISTAHTNTFSQLHIDRGCMLLIEGFLHSVFLFNAVSAAALCIHTFNIPILLRAPGLEQYRPRSCVEDDS